MLEKVDDMAMGGCFFNGDFSEDIDGLCAVCRASVDESNDGCADEVHDICKDFFTDVDLGAIDPDGYVSVLRSSNCADLKEIEGTSGLV
ncbi:hypothetical protein [Candidatus Ichthyocystis hellenicum]|nr:hypothetical protein [Candidatus Ichthyocystis hellenicum]